jgi:hypothetical protein
VSFTTATIKAADWFDFYGADLPQIILASPAPAPCRFCRYSVAAEPPTAALAGVGADADGVSLPPSLTFDVDGDPVYTNQRTGLAAVPGTPLLIEAGAAFVSGATLQSDASDKAVTKTTGIGVARALEAASAAGDVVWAVWLSGR